MQDSKNFFVIDFLEVAKELNIEFSILNLIERDIVLSTLFENFFSNRSKNNLLTIPLWQFLKKDSYLGVHLPNSANDRSLFFKNIPNKNNIMFIFDLEYSVDVYRFKDLNQLFEVLNESYNFNFYIFNSSFDFLISWNKDEVLFGSGEAREWVFKIGNNWNIP